MTVALKKVFTRISRLNDKEQNALVRFLDISPTNLKISGVPYNLLSDGNNLIDPQNKNNEIPFKENLYNPKELFDEITKKVSVEQQSND